MNSRVKATEHRVTLSTDASGRRIAHAVSDVMNPAKFEGDAFIVNACNAYDELVAALKRFANLDRSVNSGLWEIQPKYCEEARAILAKLKS